MTRDDSLTIVQMLVNSYPGNHWHEGSIDAYARAIEPLDAWANRWANRGR